MRKDLTKKTFQAALFGIIVVFLMGVVFLYFSTENCFRIMQGRSVFEELLPEEIDDQIVDITLKENFGMFMEEYSKNTKTNIEISEAFYYIIWTGNDDAEDYRYMAIKVPASYEDEMDQMTDNTYNYIESEPIELSGAIEKMSEEDYQYFKEYFIESGFTEEEFEQATIPYYISVGTLTDGAFMAYVLFGAGVLCTVLGIWLFVSALRGGYVKKAYKDIVASGYSESVAESDYESGEKFKRWVTVGRIFTYYVDKSSHARAILNRDIVWAYMMRTTHRTNGIKTATTYAVYLYTINNKKKPIIINMKNEQESDNMLAYINEKLPWVMVAYDDEVCGLYYKDYETFLQQKYYALRPKQDFAV